MRPLALTFLLLLAMSVFAQNPSSAPAQNPGVSGDSSSCYAIITIPAPRVERFQARSAPHRAVTTCTPANRFRVEYIPNYVPRADSLPANCPDCSVERPHAPAIRPVVLTPKPR